MSVLTPRAQAEAGNVDVLRGAWNREWFDELASAPFSAHDDQADSAAGAFTAPSARTPAARCGLQGGSPTSDIGPLCRA